MNSPQRNVTYQLRIVWAVGCFGNDPLNPTVLYVSINDDWVYDLIDAFIASKDVGGGLSDGLMDPGKVYAFIGTYCNGVLDGTACCQYDSELPADATNFTVKHVHWEAEEDRYGRSCELSFSGPSYAFAVNTQEGNHEQEAQG